MPFQKVYAFSEVTLKLLEIVASIIEDAYKYSIMLTPKCEMFQKCTIKILTIYRF